MRTGMSQHTQMRQEIKINPRLYQAMDLLYMPLLDLQQHLKQELLNNPFLEMYEEDEDEEDSIGRVTAGTGESFDISSFRCAGANQVRQPSVSSSMSQPTMALVIGMRLLGAKV